MKTRGIKALVAVALFAGLLGMSAVPAQAEVRIVYVWARQYNSSPQLMRAVVYTTGRATSATLHVNGQNDALANNGIPLDPIFESGDTVVWGIVMKGVVLQAGDVLEAVVVGADSSSDSSLGTCLQFGSGALCR
jgi:hypothetical protein